MLRTDSCRRWHVQSQTPGTECVVECPALRIQIERSAGTIYFNPFPPQHYSFDLDLLRQKNGGTNSRSHHFGNSSNTDQLILQSRVACRNRTLGLARLHVAPETSPSLRLHSDVVTVTPSSPACHRWHYGLEFHLTCPSRSPQ